MAYTLARLTQVKIATMMALGFRFPINFLPCKMNPLALPLPMSLLVPLPLGPLPLSPPSGIRTPNWFKSLKVKNSINENKYSQIHYYTYSLINWHKFIITPVVARFSWPKLV